MNRGQSLFEVVIALAISALIIVALVSLVSNSIRNATFAKNKTLAAGYAQELTEWLRGQRDSDPATFSIKVLTPGWCFTNLTWSQAGPCDTADYIPGTAFVRSASFSTSLVSGKSLTEADISVVWEDSQGLHEVKSATNFSDWRQR